MKTKNILIISMALLYVLTVVFLSSQTPDVNENFCYEFKNVSIGYENDLNQSTDFLGTFENGTLIVCQE